MPPAVVPLLMNALVAAMFVASFVTIAYLNPTARSARWIALSYAFGVFEPVADLAVVLGAKPEPMMMLSPATFLVGLTLMSPALSIFYGKRPMWLIFAIVVLGGLLYRWLTLDAPTEFFWYQMGFQACFAVSSTLVAMTVRKHAPRSLMNNVLVGVFIATGLHFMVKPFVATWFSTGPGKHRYADTIYAVVSQGSSGVLLIAAGLLILVSVLQTVVQTNHAQARSDPLTGLPNRLTLLEAYQALMSGKRENTSTSIALIDLDHFKNINDQFGHDGGDSVLRSVAECLASNRPSAATVARIGGEEFAVLIPALDREAAKLMCESLRISIAALRVPGISPITASIGMAEVLSGEDLADALRRADRALYEAKRSGRNRCVVFPPESYAPSRSRLSLVTET